MAANYSSLWDDDEEKQTQTGGGAVPTFAQLQQRGLPRPPPTNYGSGGMPFSGGASSAMMPPPGGFVGPYIHPTAEPAGGTGGPPGRGYVDGPTGGTSGGGSGGPNVNPGTGGGPPPDTGGGTLDQSTLEKFLYQMLTDPTSTNVYQNMMTRLQSGIDTDASRRGVYHSSIPVGIGASAGANLASQLQQEAYNNLSNYNKEMEQYLLALYGLT